MTRLTRFSRFTALIFITLSLFALSSLSVWADDDDGYLEFNGLLESRPAGTVGTWIIGGQSFEGTAATQLDTEHGPLTPGVCVEVDYYVSNGTNIAVEFSRNEAYECGLPGGNDDDDDDNDDDFGLKLYGTIDSFPSALIGAWVIDGQTYQATAATQFEQEDGPFAVGRCVEVTFQANPNTALEIETEDAYHCANNGGNPVTQHYGRLDSFPAGLVGTWVISGTSYTATTTTQFEQEDGPFFEGRCVEVKYYSHNNTALEIESEDAESCLNGGQHDDGPEPLELKLYGQIETLPTDLQNGLWTVASQDFTVTSITKLETDDGQNFVVGQCVEVEYYPNANGNLATDISTEDAYHCVPNSFHSEIYGVVETLPANLYGTWLIAGQAYQATPATQFDRDDNGDFGVGVCVKVKFYQQDGVNLATEIDLEDDCGSDDSPPSLPGLSKVYATIDSLPADSGTGSLTGTWVIGGLSYVATANTEFDTDNGHFAVGVCVEAEYSLQAGQRLLIELDSEDAEDCQGTDGSPEAKAYGTLEARPMDGLVGVWQVSGTSYTATATTEFDTEYGPLTLGAFVEVKYNPTDNTALEIETEVAPGQGRTTDTGRLESNTRAATTWVIDGQSYSSAPAIEVGRGNSEPVVGQTVIFNAYTDQAGQSIITLINYAKQFYLPLVIR